MPGAVTSSLRESHSPTLVTTTNLSAPPPVLSHPQDILRQVQPYINVGGIDSFVRTPMPDLSRSRDEAFRDSPHHAPAYTTGTPGYPPHYRPSPSYNSPLREDEAAGPSVGRTSISSLAKRPSRRRHNRAQATAADEVVDVGSLIHMESTDSGNTAPSQQTARTGQGFMTEFVHADSEEGRPESSSDNVQHHHHNGSRPASSGSNPRAPLDVSKKEKSDGMENMSLLSEVASRLGGSSSSATSSTTPVNAAGYEGDGASNGAVS